jgi:hypothetical protein
LSSSALAEIAGRNAMHDANTLKPTLLRCIICLLALDGGRCEHSK